MSDAQPRNANLPLTVAVLTAVAILFFPAFLAIS